MMKSNRITAVFDTYEAAERAISELRVLGIRDAKMSILTRHQPSPDTPASSEDVAEDVAKRTGIGLAGGAGVGALFGLAAALIPGVGPFIVAGAMGPLLGVTAGSMAAGAIVGGASGAIAGALTKAGYDEREARWYGGELEAGRVVLVIDEQGGLADDRRLREILAKHGSRRRFAA